MRARFAALPVVSAFLGIVSTGWGAPPPLPAPDRLTLELHSHLFMKEGMGWLATGDFESPLQAKDWKALFASQANAESLEKSEIGLVLATLYAHPLLTTSLRDSIRRQIDQAERFVATHPGWIIARDAAQARRALDQGKRVVVLALEGASGILETDEDLREFVDERGIRVVTLLHLTDDLFGGVAFLGGVRSLASPWAWITQLLSPAQDASGVRINANGLRDEGRAMAGKLIDHGVWIDLAHASDRAQEALAPILKARGQPHLFTHTTLRSYLGAERGITDAQLALVRETGGIVGLMPAEEMLEGTRVPDTLCGVDAPPCRGGVGALAVQYAQMSEHLTAERISLGSDTNGGLKHLHPSGPAGTGIDTQGFWNIGQQAALWDALELSRAPVPSPRRKMIDRFLEAWEKAQAARDPSSWSPTPR